MESEEKTVLTRVHLTDKGTAAAAAALMFAECLNDLLRQEVKLVIGDFATDDVPFTLACGEHKVPVTWSETEGRWETPPL